MVAGPSRVVLRPSTRSRPPASGSKLKTSKFGTPGPSSAAAPERLAPWGTPPTPLLPAWHLDALAAVPLPPDLVILLDSGATATELRTIGDLAGFWASRAEPVGIEACRALSNLVKGQPWPPRDHIVFPSETESVYLLECPLRRRARNCVGKALAGKRLDPDRPVTVGWLLSLQNFGIASLLEVMCVAEAAVRERILDRAARIGTRSTGYVTEALRASRPIDNHMEFRDPPAEEASRWLGSSSTAHTP